jgi:hypothetical protein
VLAAAVFELLVDCEDDEVCVDEVPRADENVDAATRAEELVEDEEAAALQPDAETLEDFESAHSSC